MRLIVAFFVVFVLAVPSQAAGFSWEHPALISDPEAADLFPWLSVHASISDAGAVNVAWDANNYALSNPNQVRGAHRSPAGTWSAPQLIASLLPASETASFTVEDIKTEPDGDAVALMGYLDAYYVSVRPATTGVWSAPQRVSLTDGYGWPLPGAIMDVDDSGNVVVFYTWHPATDSETPASLQRAEWNTNTGGAWTNTTVGDYSLRPQVLDFNDAGAALFVTYDIDTYTAYAETRPAGGAWSTRHSFGDQFGPPTAANLDAAGNAHVLLSNVSSCPCASHESKRPAGGSWTSPAALSKVLAADDVYFAENGKAILTGYDDAVADYVTISYDGSAWSAAKPFPPSDHDPINSEVAIAPDGTEYVIWALREQELDGTASYWGARRLPGGDWGMPQLVLMSEHTGGSSYARELLVDGGGQPVALFQDFMTLRLSRGGEWPRAEAAPAAIDFGSVLMGAESTRQVTLANTGEAPLHVSDAELTAPYTAVNAGGLAACETTLAVGASCQLTLRFAPGTSDEGPRPGTLVFTHDDARGPTTVDLSAVGVRPADSGGGDTGGGDTGGGDTGGGDTGGTTGSQTTTQSGTQTGGSSGGVSGAEVAARIAAGAKPASDGGLTLSGVTVGGTLKVTGVATGARPRAAAAAAATLRALSLTRTLAPGSFALSLKPSAKAKKVLRRKKKLKIKLSVTFTPTGGIAATTTRTLTLRYRK